METFPKRFQALGNSPSTSMPSISLVLNDKEFLCTPHAKTKKSINRQHNLELMTETGVLKLTSARVLLDIFIEASDTEEFMAKN